MDVLNNPQFMMKENQASMEYVEYQEDNAGTSANSLNIPNYRITIPASDDMVLMADSFLQVRGRIVTQEPVPRVYTSGKIALVNNGWNLFDEAKYKINSRIIETVDHPGEVRQIKSLIEYDQDFTLGQGQQEMWIPDTGNGQISQNFINATGFTAFNVTQNYAIPVVSLTGANPHLLKLTDVAPNVIANNDVVQLFYKGEKVKVNIRRYGTQILENATLQAVGTTPASIRVVTPTPALGDIIELYVAGKQILTRRTGDNTIGILRDDGTQISLYNGEAVAGNLEGGNLDEFNTGFEERRLKTVIDGYSNTGQCFELFMPIRRVFKFMQTYPIMLRGASHIIELKRNNYESMIYCEALNSLVPALTTSPKVELNYMSLWVPKIKLTLTYESLYLDSIGDQAVRFEWDTYEWERSEAFNTQSGSHDVATVSGIPKRMYVVFQKSDRLDSAISNNMVYDNMDLQEIYVKLNSQRFPEYEYEINYGLEGEESEKLYLRAYNAYLNACQVTHSETCSPSISYDQYKNLYPIYCFDLRSKDMSIFKNGSNIQIKVFWRLRNVPASPYIITSVYEENVATDIQFLSGNVSKLR